MTGLVVHGQAKELLMVVEPSQRCGCGDPNAHSGIPNGCPRPGSLDPRDRRVLYWNRSAWRRVLFALFGSSSLRELARQLGARAKSWR